MDNRKGKRIIKRAFEGMWVKGMKIIFWGHGGSDNHGCEAIVRTTSKLLNKNSKNTIILFTYNKYKDIQYGVNKIVDKIIEYNKHFKKGTILYYINYFLWKRFNYNNLYYRYANKELIKNIDRNALYLSIGGDNYCYGNFYKNLGYTNKILSSKARTILWGVSIEPQLLKNFQIINDMKRYSLIIARETITYEALIKAGLGNITRLIPDPAFVLESHEHLNNSNIKFTGKVIGINLSPLIEKNCKDVELFETNVRRLLEYLIANIDCTIIFIPHVVQEGNDDVSVLKKFYDEYKDKNSMYLIEDANCITLKNVISKCDLFIGARTHATIAAYSSRVPTLALGYSVKAKGIAKDIFGTYDNFVLSIENIREEKTILDAFLWLLDNEVKIKEQLEIVMPIYIGRVKELETILSDF